jgi:hypothetical protein
MKKLDFKKTILALGLAALAAGGANAAEGYWSNINLLKNPAFLPGWSGALTAVGEGVGEVYEGAFEIYQVLDLPEGEYTLKANAFQRMGFPVDAYKAYKENKAAKAYIFLGDNKTVIANLFDHANVSDETVLNAEGNDVNWDSYPVPNDLGASNTEFAKGEYEATVTFNHPGGELRLGIANPNSVAGEWVAFDNFKLVGPAGEVAIENGDFSTGLDAKAVWDNTNLDGAVKTPDMNKSGGVFRKTNASIYNFGQLVSLPAGTYRFGVQGFLRDGAGNSEGWYVGVKGEWAKTEGESAWDRHVAGNEPAADKAYIYVTNGWDTDDIKDEEGNVIGTQRIKPVSDEYALDPDFGNPDGFYIQTPIKCIFDEDLDVYPDNEPAEAGVTAEGYGWADSGWEYQSAACFVSNPDLYRNYIEFTLTEPTEVWVGLKKDTNPGNQYWNPFRDFTLTEYIGSDAVTAIEADENAPVEYYNLQGIRVANPANGIYLIKQGKKVTKSYIK